MKSVGSIIELRDDFVHLIDFNSLLSAAMKIAFSSRSSRYQNDLEIRFPNRRDPIPGFRFQRWISRLIANL